MSLITKYVEITPNAKNYKYYMNLGYKIPKYMDKNNNSRIDYKQKLIVKVEDLQNGCASMVKVKCDSCGKEYETHYSAYYKCKHGEESYCLSCAKKIFKVLQDKQITPKNKSYRSTYDYKKFTQAVLHRDNHTCQCCGETENLIVHHLDGYDWCVEGRISENNGITLCKYRHSLFHDLYGKGNNTKDQFEEWFNNINTNFFKNNRNNIKYHYDYKKQIYCLTTGKVFNSFREAASFYNILQQDNIRVCCNGKSKSAGKLADGTKLKWMYYKDYLASIAS